MKQSMVTIATGESEDFADAVSGKTILVKGFIATAQTIGHTCAIAFNSVDAEDNVERKSPYLITPLKEIPKHAAERPIFAMNRGEKGSISNTGDGTVDVLVWYEVL